MPDTMKSWGQRLLYAGAWLLSTVLFCVGVVLVRNLIMAGVVWAIGLLPLEYSWETGTTIGWWEEFLSQVLWLVVACVAVTATIVIELYYRKGMEQGALLKRVQLVVGIEIAAIAVSGGLLALV